MTRDSDDLFFLDIFGTDKDKDKDKDSFTGSLEFVVGYSKAPKQLQRSARPTCQSHAMTRMGREPATICIGARRATHCATGDDEEIFVDSESEMDGVTLPCSCSLDSKKFHLMITLLLNQ